MTDGDGVITRCCGFITEDPVLQPRTPHAVSVHGYQSSDDAIPDSPDNPRLSVILAPFCVLPVFLALYFRKPGPSRKV